jgi:hypothetical protein
MCRRWCVVLRYISVVIICGLMDWSVDAQVDPNSVAGFLLVNGVDGLLQQIQVFLVVEGDEYSDSGCLARVVWFCNSCSCRGGFRSCSLACSLACSLVCSLACSLVCSCGCFFAGSWVCCCIQGRVDMYCTVLHQPRSYDFCKQSVTSTPLPRQYVEELRVALIQKIREFQSY